MSTYALKMAPDVVLASLSGSYGLLALSILLLGVGPVLVEFTRQARSALAALDGFILVTVGGLVLLYVLPEAVREGGFLALLVGVAGFAGPFTVERLGERFSRAGHHILVAVVAFGFIPHALLDGVALSVGQNGEAEQHGSLLPLAVVFHRLPVGFAIWWIVRPNQGTKGALVALGLISISTVVGYALGGSYLQNFHSTAFILVEAFVGGALLHVLLHRPHGQPDVRTSSRWKVVETAGAVAGAAMLCFLPGQHGHHEGVEHGPHDGVADGGTEGLEHVAGGYADTFLHLALETAPALLVGYLAAGALAVFLPSRSISWLSQGRPWTQSLMGTVYGLPLPICSCGVVPIYRSLILRGVPATAAMAFLVATPELGVESLILSVPLLGGKLTALRILSALVVALAIGRFVGSAASSTVRAAAVDSEAADSMSLGRKFSRVFAIGFGEVLNETAPWILVGLAVAAALAPSGIGEYLALIPEGFDIPIFALAGIPLYICASGATPLAAVLILKGLSPGAAVALLLTGPATNITTYGLLSKLHGRKIALWFMLGVMLVSVALGYMVNFILSDDYHPPGLGEMADHSSPLRWVCLFVLCGAVLLSVVRQGPRGFVGMLFSAQEEEVDGHEHGHCH